MAYCYIIMAGRNQVEIVHEEERPEFLQNKKKDKLLHSFCQGEEKCLPTYRVCFAEASGDHVVYVAVFTQLQFCEVHLHLAVLHKHTLFYHLSKYVDRVSYIMADGTKKKTQILTKCLFRKLNT